MEQDRASTEVHVLMVEDSSTHARTLDEAFRLHDALDDIDVISLDLTLPDSHGLDTYLAMAKHAPDLPIVVMSGLDDDTVAFDALHAGAQDYVVKSRSNSLGFMRTLSFAIERHRLTLELQATVEQRDEKAQQLRDFIGMASHELLNPMNAVRGLAKILADQWDALDDDRRRDLATRVSRQTNNAVRVSSQFLDWARDSGGIIEVDPVAVTVGEVVGTACELADVEVERSGDLDASLFVDRSQVETMLANLLGNARKYGEGPFEVEALLLGDVIEVEVRDHGPGVPAGAVDQLFDKYDRAGRDDDRGHGLGLHLVRTLARVNGGDVTYSDRPTGGACFTLRLPAATDPSLAAAPARASGG